MDKLSDKRYATLYNKIRREAYDRPHAEEDAIDHLKLDNTHTAGNIERITFIVNYAPCKRCAGKLSELDFEKEIVYVKDWNRNFEFQKMPSSQCSQIEGWKWVAFLLWNDGKLQNVEWWNEEKSVIWESDIVPGMLKSNYFLSLMNL